MLALVWFTACSSDILVHGMQNQPTRVSAIAREAEAKQEQQLLIVKTNRKPTKEHQLLLI